MSNLGTHFNGKKTHRQLLEIGHSLALQNEKLAEEHRAAAAELNTLRGQVLEKTEKLAKATSELATSRERVSVLRGQIVGLEAKHEAAVKSLRRQILRLQDEVRSLRRSKSWTVTRPLRHMVRSYRRSEGMLRNILRWLMEPQLYGKRVRKLYAILSKVDAPHFPGGVATVASPAAEPARNLEHVGFWHTHRRQVVIVIPVYNSASEVRRCLVSVLRHTPKETQICVIDDASPQPDVAPMLSGFSGVPNLVLIRNEQNIGYTRTANRGIDFAQGKDVVLLNSDTIVTPGWLTRLQLAAYSDKRVATATPFSTNAGAFSAPHIGVENVVPARPGLDGSARAIARMSPGGFPEVPTGHGFCLFIRRDCLDEVGKLDEVAFPTGYGEENDFCMRAGRKGWKHVIDPGTWIFHIRSASFGSAKNELMAKGRAVLNARYPEYTEAIASFRQSPDILNARASVERALKYATGTEASLRPRALFVVATRTGGTPQTNADLMAALSDQYAPLTLRCDTKTIELVDHAGDEPKVLEKVALTSPIRAFPHTSSEYDDVVRRILIQHKIELVHIRHIAWHSISLPKLAAEAGIPVIFSIHDFYMLCPTVKLLDENSVFCGGRCTATQGECQHELWREPSFPPLKHRAISTWQSVMAETLMQCDALITTNNGARDLVIANYPRLSTKPFHVIPHGRDLVMQPPEFLGQVKGPLRILVPGNIDGPKGSKVIESLVDIDGGATMEFHVLGQTRMTPRPGLVLHGPYARDQFLTRVKEIDPHIGAVLSIWPETYCHTLTELWAAGLLTVGFDIGAVGERIREEGAGWVAPVGNANALVQIFDSIRGNTAKIEEKLAFLSAWQRGKGLMSTTRAMARTYAQIYRDALDRRATLLADEDRAPASTWVGSLSKRPSAVLVPSLWNNDQVAPTGWIRLLLPYQEYATSTGFELAVAEGRSLPTPGVAQTAVLQRDLNKHSLHELQSWALAWRAAGGLIVYDVDDDLSDATELRSRSSQTDLEAVVAKARWGLGAADVVTVSTDLLANKVRPLTANIPVLVPNGLDTSLWRLERPAVVRERQPGTKLTIGYVGTSTHGEDLEMISEALKKIEARYQDRVSIETIGAFERTAPLFGKRIGLPAQRLYPNFVNWLFDATRHWDIGIIPLVDNEFNRMKSNLKFLEYGALGLPIVCSSVPAYNQTAKHAVNALCIPNEPDSWFDAIATLMENSALRSELASAASQCVRSQYSNRAYNEIRAKVLRAGY